MNTDPYYEREQLKRKMRRVKNYTEILYDNEEEKKEFYDKLIPMLEKSRRENCPRRSKQEYAERIVKRVINVFWRVVLERMILYNDIFYLPGKRYRFQIARLPYRNNPSVAKLIMSNRKYQPFFSRKEGTKPVYVKLVLRDKYKKLLISELKRGHTYNFGKPIY